MDDQVTGVLLFDRIFIFLIFFGDQPVQIGRRKMKLLSGWGGVGIFTIETLVGYCNSETEVSVSEDPWRISLNISLSMRTFLKTHLLSVR